MESNLKPFPTGVSTRHMALFTSFYLSIASMLSAQKPFTDITKSSGIDHRFKVFEGLLGGGACVLDYDQDGYEDLYITSGRLEDVLYHNERNGTFRNAFAGSGLELTNKYITQGVSGADINRDGWVDLFITTINSNDSSINNIIPRAINLLFLNNGDGTFREITAEYGLDQMYSFSTGPSFGDFNEDGYPDLYVANYFLSYEGKLSAINDAVIVASNTTAPGYLLINQKGKKLVNRFKDYGLDYKGFGFGGLPTDFDNDGDLDLIINHDFGFKSTPNLLLENEYPKRRFLDRAKSLAMNLQINAMGTAAGDINGDGWMDYYFTNIRLNAMMVNQGAGKPFINLTKELGLSYVTISWGANFADFDQDGDVDLFVSNGDLNPNCQPLPDFYFINDHGHFTESSRWSGLNDPGIGRGSVTFDMDNDGDLDLLVVNQVPVMPYEAESYTRLFRNDSASGNWIKIKLQGVQADKNGLGSRIEMVAEAQHMIREIDGGGSSHLSQNSTIAHFGLGNALKADTILVKWTGGNQQMLTDVAANQLLNITESPASKKTPTWFYLAGIVLIFGALGYALGKSRKLKQA
ncbi:MAG: CRTAC1 family protein [Saprospiraceae bacterium]|nr:CRTAC1 family protein [Saprospiraceae bacterium]MCB9321071.1 CRTAC1 family protein [Lewinellaceae bacterium]